ncbi:MAG: penicillin-binding protein 1C [Candidatus Sumerlaeota bacterium]|nr:penicillin-binding protein 1C [Candidatus Sumerlaeota bacterium]
MARWLYRRRWALVKASAIAAGLFAILCAVILFWPMDTRIYLLPNASGELQDRSGRMLYGFVNDEEQWCFPRELRQISPRFIQATLATEDQRFYRHWGVDPVAVARAVWMNLRHRRIASGASTLTMQVAKRSGAPTRSFWGKARQAIVALRLEMRVAKDDILCAYLNSAPYGQNLTGCEAAARRYFGKPALELTLPEAALLAGMPRSPSALSPYKYPERALERRNHVLDRMRADRIISETEYLRAHSAPLGVDRHPFPTLAPHLAMHFKSDILIHRRLRSTLDSDIQTRTERLVAEYIPEFKGEITNAAAIVIEAPSASVLARVGSADFLTTEIAGQVDACLAVRSPGSALKPFIYALAMETHRLYASEALLDAPLDYGLYDPENFDRNFRGLVSAEDALRRSLNIPAVTVLDRVGAPAACGFLSRAGLTTLTEEPEFYGLGLALGDCGVRLEELAAAYCILANLGEYQTLKYVSPASPEPSPGASQGNAPLHSMSSRISEASDFSSASLALNALFQLPRTSRCLARGTCLKIYEMLEQPLPEELSYRETAMANVQPRVCWKTGTSTGHHDAWTFVFNQRYVVGVWLGNSDGRSSLQLTGIRAAAPLAARIFRSLETGNVGAWPAPGEDLRAVAVCALSGLPASQWCPETRTQTLPRGQFLNRVCDVHYPARFAGGEDGGKDNNDRKDGKDGKDRDGGKSGAPRQRAVVNGTPVAVRWPGAARGWDLAHVVSSVVSEGLDAAEKPGSASNKKDFADERLLRQSLKILNPADRAEFILTGEALGDRLRPSASLDGEQRLHWYMNGRYLGDSSPGAPIMLNLEPGEHQLSCMTEAGAFDRVRFKVVHPEGNITFKTATRVSQ